MNVLFTIVVIAALAMWALAVYNRLARLRDDVTRAWRRLEGHEGEEAVRTVYNRHVAAYNAALEAFPANFLAPAVGFKPARPFEPGADGAPSPKPQAPSP